MGCILKCKHFDIHVQHKIILKLSRAFEQTEGLRSSSLINLFDPIRLSALMQQHLMIERKISHETVAENYRFPLDKWNFFAGSIYCCNS